MTIWIDAQFSPAIAVWIKQEFAVEAIALRDLGQRDAEDYDIFNAARIANAAIMTKDSDFLNLLTQVGPPPTVIWVTCGNTSNMRLKTILSASLNDALDLLAAGERLIEIRDV